MEPASEGNAQRLMEMEMGTLLQDGVEERWEAISDLDAFFSRVYEYFNQRGLRCILTSRIISLLTLIFTIILTVFLFDVMNWQGGQQHAARSPSPSRLAAPHAARYSPGRRRPVPSPSAQASSRSASMTTRARRCGSSSRMRSSTPASSSRST
tara:strand:+ start:227 stop:685 length:459 start_codon:yes stop_codon:yes gene_type:complete